MSSLLSMKPEMFGKTILELTLDIFLNKIDAVKFCPEIDFFDDSSEIIFQNFLDKNQLTEKFFKEEKDKKEDNFETKNFYKIILNDLYYCFFDKGFTATKFNSSYSVLYFFKIIQYLKILIKSNENINIANNDKVKIFLSIFFMLIKGDEKFIKKLALNEGFYLGTFNELKKEYSKYEYNDSENIKNLINRWKNKSRANYIIKVSFEKIKVFLKEYGSKSDEIIKKMLDDTQDILYHSDKSFDNNLFDKIHNFYNNDDFSLILNYFSEVDYDGDPIKTGLDMNFFDDDKKKIYNKNFEPNPNSENNSDKYEIFQTKKRSRMLLSFPKIIVDYGLEDEIIICSTLRKSEPIECYKIFENIIEAIENINNIEISSYIEEIFKENDIYSVFFSIMRSDVVSNFFGGILHIKDNQFELLNSRIQDSESFKDIYNDFLNTYDKKNDGYKDFKKLIILKILSKGDRACVITKFKKYIVNPSQFYIGEKINQDKVVLKDILKGYLIIILLHETEHFFRLFNKNEEDVFNNTPRELEGGRLFIKYLFGVESISRIDHEQACKLLNIENWKNHEEIKQIFKGQKEESITKFTTKIYDKSISFYSANKNDSKGYKKNIYVPLKK